jgi:hypothetical protein
MGYSQIVKMICNKRKVDEIKAMLIIANANKPTQKSFKRREKRYYWCDECSSYHTTSKLR